MKIRPPEEPEGSNTVPVRPTMRVGTTVGMSRDAQTDSRSHSEVDITPGSNPREGVSADLDDRGYLIDTAPGTLADEIRDQGWIDIGRTSDGATPRKTTSGGRGANDIGKIPGAPERA